MKRPSRRSRGVEQVATAPSRRVPAERSLAFDELYRGSRDDVYAYVAGLLRDTHAAEDVTALAFERAYRRRTASLQADPEDLAASAPDDDAEQALRRTALREAVSGLDPRERELIALRFFAGLGHAEIGQVLGISSSNAGTRLHRAIDKLRRACNEAP